ncbi:MAG TPA: peptidoglycan-associated lipoprotein Pal [Nitrospira sp.]|nr:peptidoglycan-associated lipoprotein Pal [Nitrospira sp.]
MNSISGASPVVWLLLSVAVFSAATGCSKRAVSSAGDQAAALSEPAPPAPAEPGTPDQMAAVPEPAPSPIPAEREFTPPTQPETPAEPAPSQPEPPAPAGVVPPEVRPDTPAAAVAPTEETAPPAALAEPTAPPAAPAEPPPPAAAPPVPPAPAPAASPEPVPSPRVGELSDIFFDFDRYTIRQDAQPVLESDADWIKQSPARTILIEGHCDERGTEAYNLVLGEKRAKAARQYLLDLGVAASRLKIVSLGKMRPFCKQHTEDCYQSNRRAHFVPQ